ncbi:hypothetical protein KFK09_004570 [Dendrobium nobile]|uniref:Mitochondrial protein n=1 Tax=Dendrobium nobile TaxID=94219 RepID=A0A8T3C6L5_DENNO|nr:hypothetical protein KFK09_004570 [Dendrobium nobile]
MAECKPISSPIPSKVIADPTKTAIPLNLATADFFRHLVGSLQYLTLTRPDISFTVNKLCQHMRSPDDTDIKLLKRLLRYIKGTIKFGLPITATSLGFHAYSDSDWAGDPLDRKSTTSFVLFSVATSFLGKSKNKRLLPVRLPKQNIVLLLRLLRILSGFSGYYRNFKFFHPSRQS